MHSSKYGGSNKLNKKLLVSLIVMFLLLSISGVHASERISATPDDYFAYYGSDTPAGQTHSFAIVVDGNVYYVKDPVANRLAYYSLYFRQVYDYDLEKFSEKFMPDAMSIGTNGYNFYYNLNRQADDEMFNFPNDKSFDFEYVGGQRVGYNSNAKVVTKIYYPHGGEITDTYY